MIEKVATKWPVGLAVLVALMVIGCQPAGAPLSDVRVVPAIISPNADGKDDLARITYRLHAPARVSIYLIGPDGKRFDLRRDVERSASPAPYELLFNGVANGRLMPNGDYTWHVEAQTTHGQSAFSGSLRIEQADMPFPKLQDFTLSSTIFTPNRDGIDDRVYINVYLTARARLNVYVVGADGFRYEVQRREGLQLVSSDAELGAGRYNYDYDGGIDLGADPPPNGLYTVVAQSQDAIGQRDTVTASLVITQSGRPNAEIVVQPDGSGVIWARANGEPPPGNPNEAQRLTFGLGETLHFTMAVRNTGLVPIRTAGPFDPNDCYRMDENRYTKGFPQEPGVFRVGVDYETNTGSDHPWRWGVGSLDDLDIVLRDGQPLYYLAPGKQVLVRGCIQLTQIPVRNPFYVWASLIHEDVEITAINNRVSPVLIQIVKP
ncbi:MAG: hypothetical protein RMN25_12050 [Anaerolineae bacterium]|nr:hypothetical protein [Thermoflexales bacterium]MDW8408503.1 hypothetical protein [Anaerolineae bacterium]